MEKKIKIFVILVHGSGHINPVTGLVHELVRNRNCEVVFYGFSKHKHIIENTGAQFRSYLEFPTNFFQVPTLKENLNNCLLDLFAIMINFSYKQIPILLLDVEKEKPDCIIYDQFALHARYLLNILDKNYKNGHTKLKPPKGINIFTSFANKLKVYPNQELLNKFLKYDIKFFIKCTWIYMKQIKFSIKFRIKVWNPFNFILNEDEKLNLVAVFPEFQPNVEKFSSNYKFVGCLVDENVRMYKKNDNELKKLLDLFKPLNPSYTFKKENKSKLIYVSLGTVFNNNALVFDKIIQSVKILNQEDLSLTFIFSLGSIVYEKFKRENYNTPENVFLMETCPQIEILQRASLFITHCGMNSVSEAIYYGVPVICIPIAGDQPFVAYRVVDELKLGLRLDPRNFSPIQIKNSIVKVLTDKSVLERMLEFSKLSRKFDGKKQSADFVIKYLKTKE